MICPACARAADTTAELRGTTPVELPAGHRPQLCRDAAVQPHGCGCQHGASSGRVAL